MQYLYRDGDSFHFMDTILRAAAHSEEALGEAVNYIIPDAVINVEFYGEEPVGIELPVTVDLKVEDTALASRGHRQFAGEARRLETGLVVNVPPFVNPATSPREHGHRRVSLPR